MNAIKQLHFERKCGYSLESVEIQQTAASISACSLTCLSSTEISCESFEFESQNNSCRMSSSLLKASGITPSSDVQAYEGILSQCLNPFVNWQSLEIRLSKIKFSFSKRRKRLACWRQTQQATHLQWPVPTCGSFSWLIPVHSGSSQFMPVNTHLPLQNTVSLIAQIAVLSKNVFMTFR